MNTPTLTLNIEQTTIQTPAPAPTQKIHHRGPEVNTIVPVIDRKTGAALLKVRSRKHGDRFVLVDKSDYERVRGFKWAIYNSCSLKTGRVYFSTTMLINNKPKKISLHRFLMLSHDPEQLLDASIEIDHQSAYTDLRKSQLRVCTTSENSQSRKKRKHGTSSKYKGVSWYTAKGLWVSQLKINGVSKLLGYFPVDQERAAAMCYDQAARKVFTNPKLNFPYHRPKHEKLLAILQGVKGVAA
jgi:hypothetical protein